MFASQSAMTRLLKAAYYVAVGISTLVIGFFFFANLLGATSPGETWVHKVVLSVGGSSALPTFKVTRLTVNPDRSLSFEMEGELGANVGDSLRVSIYRKGELVYEENVLYGDTFADVPEGKPVVLRPMRKGPLTIIFFTKVMVRFT